MVSLAICVCVFHFVGFDIEKIAFLKDGFLSPIGQLRSFGISLPPSFTLLFLLVTCDFGSRTLKNRWGESDYADDSSFLSISSDDICTNKCMFATAKHWFCSVVAVCLCWSMRECL